MSVNLALDTAYVHVFIPVEMLIWIRSISIVLLIVAHALRHVQLDPEQSAPDAVPAPQPTPLALTPELIDALRAALAQVTISEKPEMLQALPSPQSDQWTNEGEHQINASQEPPETCGQEQGASNHERVKAYLAEHPEAKVRDVAAVLKISVSTANKWMNRIKGKRS